MAKQSTHEIPSLSLVGPGTTIIGEISTSGDFRIDGTLIGSIRSTGKVVIGESGKLEGTIVCQNADLSGQIKANIEVKELLSLKASAKVQGDLITRKLAIETGAVLAGTCYMIEGDQSETFALSSANAPPKKTQ